MNKTIDELLKENNINPSDLRIDSFGLGMGGEHGGVRITHLPSGISAESREDKSLRANKILALTHLIEKAINSEPKE